MNKVARISYAGVAIVLTSALLTRAWLTRLDLFPDIPKPLAEYLVDLYGAENAEQVADLELLIGFFLSFVIVTTFVVLGWYLWRLVKKAKP